jgi:hypothetical protein
MRALSLDGFFEGTFNVLGMGECLLRLGKEFLIQWTGQGFSYGRFSAVDGWSSATLSSLNSKVSGKSPQGESRLFSAITPPQLAEVIHP